MPSLSPPPFRSCAISPKRNDFNDCDTICPKYQASIRSLDAPFRSDHCLRPLPSTSPLPRLRLIRKGRNERAKAGKGKGQGKGKGRRKEKNLFKLPSRLLSHTIPCRTGKHTNHSGRDQTCIGTGIGIGAYTLGKRPSLRALPLLTT